MTKHRINILGVGVSPTNMDQTLNTINSWIQNKQQNYVCITPVHSVMMCQDDESLRSIYNRAGLVTPDGMPLVWLSRLQGHSHVGRVYGPDLMLALCQHSIHHKYRHFFYGGAEGVATQLVANLHKQFPNLQVAGTYCPPFRPLSKQEDNQIVQMINGVAPDIIWVGLGAPKQEYWMASHMSQLNATVLIGVGAAFDFHAGVKRQAPLWMQRNGLEWFFRFMTEPRRLWKRYLINNPLFVCKVALQWLGIQKYKIN